jgi:hypothetical protein
LWERTNVSDGHPVFEPTLQPWKVCPDPGVEEFAFDYSPTEIMLHWGTAVRSIRSGRCMFGLDANDDLVSVGVIDVTEAEYGRLRLAVGADVRGVPVSQLQDWQLAALQDVVREQLGAHWTPGPKARHRAFVELTQHANDIEREMERRRDSR